MHVLVTGADGFIGRALVRHLAATGRLRGQAISRLSLLDRALGAAPTAPFVQPVPCDLADTAGLEAWLHAQQAAAPVHAVFHLASIPGGAAEQEPLLARRVNLDASTALLEAARAQVLAGGPVPVFVFASSIAVLGTITAPVDDDTLPRPVLSYGAHKLITEILLTDSHRRGWVQGLALRLPGVLARPPARTGQLSAFLSDFVRELAAGRPFTCPTGPQAATWASSLPCVVQALVHAVELPGATWPVRNALTLPTLHFTMAELATAIAQAFGTPAHNLVQWAPDARIEALFGRFPPLRTPAADAAGFAHDGSLVTLVRRALADG
jgi:nucleoside-diphosphate-sugar epimerase